MEYLTLIVIGLAAGLFGGLLGIGGAVIMIPALVIAFGENQHLYHATAMICNSFVAASATVVHKRAGALMPSVLKYLVPPAAVGIVIGVVISNSSIFARQNSYLLARVLGLYMIYEIIYNCLRFKGSRDRGDGLDISGVHLSIPLTILTGFLTGLIGGLLGLGGGVVCVPFQQLFLKMPLKRAISNSAATVAAISLIGALYKNLTLPQQNIAIVESLKLAMVIIPGAIIGGLAGGRLMYILPKNVVRAVFVLILAIASYKLLTVTPAV